MRSTTHTLAAIATLPFVWRYSPADGIYVAAISVGILIGAKAPDWLEVARWTNGRRESFIAHRTITHTWWVWALLALLTWAHIGTPPPAWIVYGFCVSCILHIFLDAMTPMGVPVLSPFGRRFRFTGRKLISEFLVIVASLAVLFLGVSGNVLAH